MEQDKLANIKGWAQTHKAAPLTWDEIPGAMHSAVMCLVTELEGRPDEFYLVVTKRTLKVRTHKGQLALAGGHRDPEDKGPIETALRETYEELGIAPDSIEIFGALPYELSIHRKTVVPIYGYCRINPDHLTPSPEEVAKVIFVPMEKIWRGQEKSVNFRLFGLRRHSFVYRHEGHHIWGLTAKIIYNAHFSKTKGPF